ncbi:hypothetical protein, partial [Roseobacter sp. GAI101]|uniref:hypothetical protein n=1 Tax=Roseobacter sp. (strain GAI101) TaxID=391589 RepID=UPI001C2FB4D3
MGKPLIVPAIGASDFPGPGNHLVEMLFIFFHTLTLERNSGTTSRIYLGIPQAGLKPRQDVKQ